MYLPIGTHLWNNDIKLVLFDTSNFEIKEIVSVSSVIKNDYNREQNKSSS